MDWVDPDDLSQPNGAEIAEYKAAGLSYGPKNAPFDTVSELQQVLGMTYALYEKIEPAHHDLFRPQPTRAPRSPSPMTLQALYPEATPEQIQQLIQQRQSHAAAAHGRRRPDSRRTARPSMAGGGGLTYSVKSRAKLPNGASTVLDATIRMGGISTGRSAVRDPALAGWGNLLTLVNPVSRQTTGPSADASCQDAAAGLLRVVGQSAGRVPAGALARAPVDERSESLLLDLRGDEIIVWRERAERDARIRAHPRATCRPKRRARSSSACARAIDDPAVRTVLCIPRRTRAARAT